MGDALRIENHGGVRRLTLCRPAEYNTITPVLRDELATSIPALATRLDCSRPAASDAVDRLVAAELATEVTDRARDRVFALTAALESAGIT